MKEFSVVLPTSIYSVEAIFSAAYNFIDRVYVLLEEAPKKSVRVTLQPKKDLDDDGLKAVEGDFRNELLHHALRLKVAVSNQKLREYIVTRALLSVTPEQPMVAGNQPGPDGRPNDPAEMKPGPDGVPGGSDDPGSSSKPGPDGIPNPNQDVQQGPAHNLDGRPVPDDDQLAAEIQKLLAEVDKGGDEEDPLGIVAPWEEKEGAKKEAAEKLEPEELYGPKKKAQDVDKKATSAAEASGAEPAAAAANSAGADLKAAEAAATAPEEVDDPLAALKAEIAEVDKASGSKAS